jgi:outer membrane lipoprotein-sorting protein
MRSFIPFDLTLDQVVGAFSGAFPFPSESPESYTIDEDMFLLSFVCGTKHCKYWVDNRYLLVRKYEMRDDHDNLIMDATTSSFVDDGSTYAPKRIRIRFPSQDRQLSVSYSSITVNDPRPSFAYTIPSNARTIVR